MRSAIESLSSTVESLEAQQDDPIVRYLQNSGMIKRGWINESVAIQASAIKKVDRQGQIASKEVRMFFMLALIASVVRDLSNVKFGPEIYCVPAPTPQPDVASCFLARLNNMLADLESWNFPSHIAKVRLGDSRDGRTLRTAAKWGSDPAYIVTSPPYPTEHDYTRNSRLELVFMESVAGTDSLRRIKRRMIRSHSKGIYVGDRDAHLVDGFEPVQRIKRQIEERIPRESSGFEGQYSKVITNYFGGMLRHFRALSKYLPTGSRLAYVVGDEASYKGVHIPTAHLLAEMADAHIARLKIDHLTLWRSRRKHKTRPPLHEHIISLRIE